MARRRVGCRGRAECLDASSPPERTGPHRARSLTPPCGWASRRRSGPPTTAPAPTSRSSRRSPRASSCACSATRRANGRGDELRIDVSEIDGHIWHVYLPDVRPGQHYGWRVHGPWNPSAGPVVQLVEAADRPVRQGDRRLGRLDARPASATTLDDPDKPNFDDSAPHVPLDGRRRPVLRLGQRPAAAPPDARHRDLRGPRPRPHDAAPRHPRRPARHLLGGRPPGDHRAPRQPRRHRDRADAGAPVHPRPPPPPARPEATTGATTRSRSSRRTTATRTAGCSARRRSSSRW